MPGTSPATTDAATPRRVRVLFVGEAVTLAHVTRPLVLARALDPRTFEVSVAWDARYNALLGTLPPYREIDSIPSARFLASLAKGAPLYDVDTLLGYVTADLRLLDEVKPDVVVGDFRLSLSISARLAGVRYLTLTNAYWSPYARQRFPMPDLPIARRLGVTLAHPLFRVARPFAFALHTRPLNAVRRVHGLPSLGYDLRRVYTDADEVLYADVPELVPTFDLPATHHYLGPILWSPAVPRPTWWERVPEDRPIVYVTLGSSGRADLLSLVLRGLADLPVTVLAATAGRTSLADMPANAFAADFLPGEEAAARAKLVVCNGGSPTTQQALSAGVPVLGVASNMDQYLNMEAVRRAGAGELVRAGSVSSATIRQAASKLLASADAATAAKTLAGVFARRRPERTFASILRGTPFVPKGGVHSECLDGSAQEPLLQRLGRS